MLRNVYLKTLREKRRSIVGWTIGLVALAAYTTALFPVIQESAEDLSGLVERLPRAFRALTNSSFDFTTGAGFLSSQTFGFLVPLLMIVFLVGFGARTVAGEEQEGRLELVLATPVPRRQIVAEKLGAMITALVLLSLVLWLAFSIGDAAAGLDVGPANLAAAVANAALVALSFGTLALAVGCSWGSRPLAGATAAAVATATYLLNAFASLVDALQPASYLSPWRYYEPRTVLLGGMEAADVLVLVGVSVVFSLVAVLSFDRRDVSA